MVFLGLHVGESVLSLILEVVTLGFDFLFLETPFSLELDLVKERLRIGTCLHRLFSSFEVLELEQTSGLAIIN